ncbi:Shikimate kinase I [Nitrincola lacisaponensis]|uniref:Shikimate kinase n=2 Tax=Nitrincola lacisaponensis TaxID=267850 RepID=A0A063Y023_9GAMM|nr:Shikimate kinase I [Nitrincola lacisaponensis]
MGAGKSTIGRLLAQELSSTFIDSDKVIEERSGADIPWIFDVEGEAGFREREMAVISELTQLNDCVLATGGGVVLRPENRECLQNRGVVVYLQTSIEQQLERTARDRNRPLLQTANPEEVLRKLLEQRDPLYKSCADIIIRTDKRHPRAVIQEILRQLKQLSKQPS